MTNFPQRNNCCYAKTILTKKGKLLNMNPRYVFILTAILMCVETECKVNDSTAVKYKAVMEAVEFGWKKLKEFRMQNPVNDGRRLKFGIPVKSGFSNDLEAEAIARIEATKRLTEITGLTEEALRADAMISEAFALHMCKPHTIRCNPSEYRTMDGSCNNLQNPDWGKSFTPQRRFLSPVYSNGDQPRTSTDLPSPRALSNNVFKATENVPNEEYTGLVMAWGQFIDHDIVFTPTAGDLDCCEEPNAENPICFPIEVPEGDDTFDKCLTFVRSAAAPSDDCISSQREQINELTSFIDGSMLYGSSDAELAILRDDTDTHLMKTKEPGNLLPAGNSECTISVDPDNDYCQQAGDERVNVIPTLGALHILVVREHNRIARQLTEMNPTWNQEKVFQETRKIMGAIIQHITYNEYLPLVIGDEAVSLYNIKPAPTGYVNTYDRKVDPSIRNSFAAAAFRYGHSIIMPTQSYLDKTYMNQEDFSLASQQLNPHIIEQNNGARLDDLIRWASFKPAMASDRLFEDGIRNHLFGNSDLPSRSIQRGRDHGLPPYNKFRNFCGLTEAQHFGTGPNGLIDHSIDNAAILQSMYQSVDDIDLYVGGITENLVEEGEVGPTFACLIGKQFEAIKTGDAFWYERPGITGFSPAKLTAIKKVVLSGLLCEHFGLDTIQPNPFEIEVPGMCPGSTDPEDNCMVPCSDFEPIDLTPWKV